MASHNGINPESLLPDPKVTFGAYTKMISKPRKEFMQVFAALGIRITTEEENEKAIKAEEEAARKRDAKANSKAALK
jgi:hypothetical protein